MGCRNGMHHVKNHGNKDIHYIPPHNSGKGLRLILLVSLIVLLREFPCFHDFSCGASHPYILIQSMECFLHLYTCTCIYVHVQCIYIVHVYMYVCRHWCHTIIGLVSTSFKTILLFQLRLRVTIALNMRA